MAAKVQELARKIERAFIYADRDHDLPDGEILGYRHLALVAAEVVLEEGMLTD